MCRKALLTEIQHWMEELFHGVANPLKKKVKKIARQHKSTDVLLKTMIDTYCI